MALCCKQRNECEHHAPPALIIRFNIVTYSYRFSHFRWKHLADVNIQYGVFNCSTMIKLWKHFTWGLRAPMTLRRLLIPERSNRLLIVLTDLTRLSRLPERSCSGGLSDANCGRQILVFTIHKIQCKSNWRATRGWWRIKRPSRRRVEEWVYSPNWD